MLAGMIGRDIACNREQPRFERTLGLIRVARLEQREHHLLVYVFDLIWVGDAAAQEPHQRWAYIVEQHSARVCVALLQAHHQLDAPPALLRTPLVVHIFHSVSGTGGYAGA
jgi:hypothetical protein